MSSTLWKRKSKLVELSYELSIILASELTGEAFHPDYLKNKDAFRQLMSSHTKLEWAMKRYFKNLAERLRQSIDWRAYQTKLITGADQPKKITTPLNDITKTIDWQDETVKLHIIFHDTLKPAYAAGIAAAHTELNLASYLTPKDSPVQAALRDHALKLAKGLNQTTKDRITESLKSSIAQGLTTDDAANALADIVDDPQRAQLIANTESVNAYSQGKLAVADEVGAEGKTWQAIPDGACPICQDLDGQTIAIDDTFDADGDEVDGPPGHPNCVLPDTIVTSPDAKTLMRAHYSGRVFKLLFASGNSLTVTPNHMLLTDRGFLTAERLRQGDNVISGTWAKRSTQFNPDNNKRPANIAEIFASLHKASGMTTVSMPATAKDFHSDGRFCDGKVDIVSSGSLLRDSVDSTFIEQHMQGFLGGIHPALSLIEPSNLYAMLLTLSAASDGLMGSHSIPDILRSTPHLHHLPIRLQDATNYHARLVKASTDSNSGAFEPLRQAQLALPGLVETDNLIGIEIGSYDGHVYDVSSMSTSYIANGYISSNCRCLLQLEMTLDE